MKRRRPGSVLTFAILNFVFGGLGLACGVMGLPGVADSKMEINGRDVSQEYKAHMDREVPFYSAWQVGGPVTGLALSLGFVASGVGLLLMKNWARFLAISCAGLAILFRTFDATYQIALVNPAMTNFFRNTPLNLGGIFAGATTLVLVVRGIFVLAYCATLLIILLNSGTARAFREGGVEVEAEDERPRGRRPARYEDEDDDDLPPRRPDRRIRRD
jgi:hypothetical protein